MKALKILKKSEFNNYVLQDIESGKTYNLVLEFYDTLEPDINDEMIINEKLLDPSFEGYSKPYAFTTCDKKLEDFINAKEELEYIVLNTNKKNIVLKRIYG